MKLTVAPMAALLLLVLATVSAQDTRSVRTRVKEQVQTWATIQAHCAEASLTDGSIDNEKALECKKYKNLNSYSCNNCSKNNN